MAVSDPSSASARGSKALLVPWDPESTAHTQRLYDQRVACGWKKEKIEAWRKLQREGKMAIHWVVLSEDDPAKEMKLQQHITTYPTEQAPLSDTASSLGGKSREHPPYRQPFIPVGHISLDSTAPDPDLADPAKGLYYISTFYISEPLQGNGLGRAAMDAVEGMATEAPLCAKALALDTLDRELVHNPEFWKSVESPPPKLCNQDWYARRGYEVVKYDDSAYIEVDPMGKFRSFRAVYMMKEMI